LPIFSSSQRSDSSMLRQTHAVAPGSIALSLRLAPARALLRVFIAEDSKDCRNRLIEMLQATGVAKIEAYAETAEVATREVLRMKPDVLILDLVLRQGSGLDVLRATAASNPAMRVAVVTNNATEQYRRACETAGAHAFLDKSLDIDRLPGLLQRWAADKTGESSPNELN